MTHPAGGGGGTFTLTGIPAAYNGNYAIFFGEGDVTVAGYQSVRSTKFTMGQIKNGSVNLPMWIDGSSGTVRYKGNDDVTGMVYIFDTSIFDVDESTDALVARLTALIGWSSVYFSSGSVSKAWSTGTVVYERSAGGGNYEGGFDFGGGDGGGGYDDDWYDYGDWGGWEGGGQAFDNITAFDTWLKAQTDNSTATTYNVKLNLSSLTGTSSTSVRNVLRSATNKNKYVKLDFSGSTFTTLAESAFDDCPGLINIILPNTVTSIGRRAFYNCTSLAGIAIPSRVTSIGVEAFRGCITLTGINIPSKVTSIGEGAFRGCTSLASVGNGSGVTSIGNYAFAACSVLTEITISSKTTSIGSYAFQACVNLNNINISDSVTGIGSYAFQGCTALSNLTIGYNVVNIGTRAFDGCSSLTSVTIPASVTSIGEYAFYNCSSLTTVIFQGNGTGFNNYAFYGLGDLKAKYDTYHAGIYTKAGTVWTWEDLGA